MSVLMEGGGARLAITETRGGRQSAIMAGSLSVALRHSRNGVDPGQIVDTNIASSVTRDLLASSTVRCLLSY
jgi:hypothetical protein